MGVENVDKKDTQKENILVSIIVPIYNTKEYLHECIDSIISQSYSNLEIILVDDGSYDGSELICDEYKVTDCRVAVIHQENAGLPVARNVGLKSSRGEYVAFIDCDDCINVDFVKQMLETAIWSKCRIVQCGAIPFIGAQPQNLRNASGYKIVERREALKILLNNSYKGIGVVMPKLYHSNVFSNIRFADGRHQEDEFVVYQLLWEAGDIAFMNGAYYYYRSKRQGSLMHSGFNIRSLDLIEARTERVKFFESQEEDILYHMSYRSCLHAYIEMLEKMRKAGLLGTKEYAEVKKGFWLDYKLYCKDKQVGFLEKIKVFTYAIVPSVYRFIREGIAK